MDLFVFVWIIAIVGSGLALEAYGVITRKGTITESVRDAAKAYVPVAAIVSLILGALWAHFFWQ